MHGIQCSGQVVLGCVEACPLRGSVLASHLVCQAEAGRQEGGLTYDLIVRDRHSAVPTLLFCAFFRSIWLTLGRREAPARKK